MALNINLAKTQMTGQRSPSAARSLATPEVTPVALTPPYYLAPSIESEEEFETYFSLTKELGITNRETVREQIRQVCKFNNYQCYDCDNASKYLDFKLGDWSLHSVRDKDLDRLKGVAWADKKVQATRYQRKIPLNVLEKIQIIADAVPSVYFAISDNTELKNVTDNFLFVMSMNDLPVYIPAYWTEITFEDVS